MECWTCDRLRDAVTDRTVIVSIMTANNEIGVLQPIAEIAAIAHERGVLLHTDAVQAVGKVPFDVAGLGVDLASMTAHKMYGPKGVGALYVRRAQSEGRARGPDSTAAATSGAFGPGTLNVPGIVGFGKAAEIARDEMPAESARLGACATACSTGSGPTSRSPRQRLARAPPPAQPERQLP